MVSEVLPRESTTGVFPLLVIHLLFVPWEFVSSPAVAVLVDDVVAIMMSAGITKIGFSVLRYVVVWDIEEGACVIRLRKVDICGRYGEELLI